MRRESLLASSPQQERKERPVVDRVDGADGADAEGEGRTNGNGVSNGAVNGDA